MADIQLQLQNIIKLAKVANTQLAEIKITILQANDGYRVYMARDIFSILEDLWNIIQENMENQIHYIQALLANKLNKYKGKGNSQADNHIRIIQNTYQDIHYNVPQTMIINRREQKENRIQEEVFLYKPYNILLKSSRPKTPELTSV